jgi:hypothetical protein
MHALPCPWCRVEKVLKECGAAILWVTHDTEQPRRLGGRLLELPSGTIGALPEPAAAEAEAAGAAAAPGQGQAGLGEAGSTGPQQQQQGPAFGAAVAIETSVTQGLLGAADAVKLAAS